MCPAHIASAYADMVIQRMRGMPMIPRFVGPYVVCQAGAVGAAPAMVTEGMAVMVIDGMARGSQS